MVGGIRGQNKFDKSNKIIYNKDLIGEIHMNKKHETVHDTLTNITNITNINDLTNIKKLIKQNNELALNEVAPLSVGGVIVPKVGVGREIAHLPEKWRSAKFDLFNNATDDDLIKGKYNYTLSLNIFKYNHSEQDKIFNCKAKLNRTNLDLFNADIDKTGSHYKTCRSLRDELRVIYGTSAEHISLNKFYQSNYRGGKARIIDNLSAILMRFANEHQLIMIYKNETYSYKLPNTNISPKARQSGCIGSLVVTNDTNEKYKKINLDDEGL